MRQINQAGIDLIKSFEGLRLNAYKDSVGIPTIGWGHTKGVKIGDKITKAMAEQLLHEDLAQAEAGVTKLVKINISNNQFAALVSFVFNLGLGAFANSTLLARVNKNNLPAAGREFGRWVHAGGKVLPGLVKRREAERKLFES